MSTRLVVVQGRPEGMEIPVLTPRFLVGRDPQCNLRPSSEVVSRMHCEIIERDDALFVRDLGSTNGTFVNGKQVEQEVQLQHGDQLQVGSLVFELQIQQVPQSLSGGQLRFGKTNSPSSELRKPRSALGAKTPVSGMQKLAESPRAKLDNGNEEETKAALNDDTPSPADESSRRRRRGY